MLSHLMTIFTKVVLRYWTINMVQISSVYEPCIDVHPYQVTQHIAWDQTIIEIKSNMSFSRGVHGIVPELKHINCYIKFM